MLSMGSNGICHASMKLQGCWVLQLCEKLNRAAVALEMMLK